MSRYDPLLYSEPWMKNVIEDAKKRLDSPRRFQTDIRPTMWDTNLLGCSPKDGEEVKFAFTPGFIVTFKVGNRVLTYHTDNKETIRLASDVEEVPPDDEE